MPSILQTTTDVTRSLSLIEEAANVKLIQSKFIKVGSKLPNWSVSHNYEWTNGSGNFDMQQYLHDYLQQFGLEWTINGNNQIEIIAFP